MRKAFTLIELLVVIFVIGLLAALLLPAVQWGREAARRLQCTNHQRQLAQGLHSYENARGSLPGWRDFITVAIPDGVFGPRAPGDEIAAQASWVFSILPYIEQVDLFDRLKTGQVAMGTPIPSVALLHCPSHLEGPASRTMNYIVNGGAVDDFAMRDNPVTTDGNIANGPFLDRCRIVANDIPDCIPCRQAGRYCRYNANVAKYRNAIARLSDISRMDGTAYTLLTSENVQRGYWISDDIVHFYNNRTGASPRPLTAAEWAPANFLPDGRRTVILTGFGLAGDTIEGSVAFVWPRYYASGQPDNLLCQIAYLRGGTFATPGNTKQGFTGACNDPEGPNLVFPRIPIYDDGDTEMIPVWLNMFTRKTFADHDSWYPSARPSSHHGPVVIVSFTDGNVRRLNQDMEEVVFVQLMTAGDAQSDAGWRSSQNPSPPFQRFNNFLEGRLLNTGTVFQ